jgi:hypothetical protein
VRDEEQETMQIRYETTLNGENRAVTTGLAEMGQTEFALVQTANLTEDAAARVLRYIADYVVASGRHIKSGETMRYGWSTLRFSPSSDGTNLMVEELANPFSPRSDTYVRGAATALAILLEQDATVRRNGVQTIAHHPHRSELAVICRYVTPQSDLMVFDRLKSTRQDDSGWFVGCGNPNHNHNDANELGKIHLVHLAEISPKIVAYLAMPEDTRVVFDHGSVIVFAPGQDDGRDDTGAI